MSPCDYTRTREIPELLEAIHLAGPNENACVLDMASPQLLSAHLCREHPGWSVTYANIFEPELHEAFALKNHLQLGHLELKHADLTQAGCFEPDRFDLIVSCSVLEHVPDVDGKAMDSEVVRHAFRWLKPGGHLALSVPYAREGFDETRPSSPYELVQKNGEEEVFFQRFYDRASLERRILKASDLELIRARYIGERFMGDNIHRRLGPRMATQSARFFLGRLFPLISSWLMESGDSPEALQKPYLAILLLRKP